MIQFTHEQFIVFESQIYKTTSVVVHTKDMVIVIDPNLLPNEVEEIRQFVDRVKGNKPLYILFTHSDWDHIVGFGAFPDAIVIASEQFTQKSKDEILNELLAFDSDYYIDRPYPYTYPNVNIKITFDGQQLKLGNTTVTFYKAEGHTNDGIFTVIEPVGLFVAGDYLSNVEFPFIYDNSERYMETLEKMDNMLKTHSIQFLVPGHGHLTNDLDEMKERKELSLSYIQQLRQLVQEGKESIHLINEYRYKQSLKTCHEENIELIKRELNM